MLREDGRDIIFSAYDATQNNNAIFYRLSWNDIASINNGSIPTPSTVSNPIIDALTTLNFRGTDNNVTYAQGARSIKVVADIGSEEIDMNMELPQTTEDASQVYTLALDNGGTAYLQPHQKRTGTGEFFYYYEVDSQGSGPYPRLIGSSTFDKCLSNSVIFNPFFNPHNLGHISTHTGAIPIRWFRQTSQAESIKLKNGILINVYNMWEGYSYQPRSIYSLKTQTDYDFREGWLHLDMSIRTFRTEESSAGKPMILFDYRGTHPLFGDDINNIYISIQFGNLFWDKDSNSWRTTSEGINTSKMKFTNGVIESNKPTGIPIEKDGGYFIPIPTGVRGKLSVTVYNIAQNTSFSMSDHNMHAYIIDTLNLSYISTAPIPASTRTQNVYYRNILSSGFSDKMEIDLGMATNNNNKRCNGLVLNKDGYSYVEQRNYIIGTLRPELFLLHRIANYYNKTRRAYLCLCEPLSNISQNIYRFNNKAFIPLASHTNWQDDIQEVKMLEMKDLL